MPASLALRGHAGGSCCPRTCPRLRLSPARAAGLRHGPPLAVSAPTKAPCAHRTDIPVAAGPRGKSEARPRGRRGRSPAAGAAGGARWGRAAVLPPLPRRGGWTWAAGGRGGTPGASRQLQAGAQGMGCGRGCCGSGEQEQRCRAPVGAACPPCALPPNADLWDGCGKGGSGLAGAHGKAKSSFGHIWPPAALVPHLTSAFKDSAGPPLRPPLQGGGRARLLLVAFGGSWGPPACRLPVGAGLPAAGAGEGWDLPAGAWRDGGGFWYGYAGGSCHPKAGASPCPTIEAVSARRGPRSWGSDDSSACLPLCPIPSRPPTLVSQGLWCCTGEPRLPSAPRYPHPTGGSSAHQVVTSQVQVAHLQPALGSLWRRGQPGGMPPPSGAALAPQLPLCALSQVGLPQHWVLPPPWGEWSRRAGLAQRAPRRGILRCWGYKVCEGNPFPNAEHPGGRLGCDAPLGCQRGAGGTRWQRVLR